MYQSVPGGGGYGSLGPMATALSLSVQDRRCNALARAASFAFLCL